MTARQVIAGVAVTVVALAGRRYGVMVPALLLPGTKWWDRG